MFQIPQVWDLVKANKMKKDQLQKLIQFLYGNLKKETVSTMCCIDDNPIISRQGLLRFLLIDLCGCHVLY